MDALLYEKVRALAAPLPKAWAKYRVKSRAELEQEVASKPEKDHVSETEEQKGKGGTDEKQK